MAGEGYYALLISKIIRYVCLILKPRVYPLTKPIYANYQCDAILYNYGAKALK